MLVTLLRATKMSSPKLNNVIILGAMLCYVAVVLFGLDARFLSSETYGLVCNVSEFQVNMQGSRYNLVNSNEIPCGCHTHLLHLCLKTVLIVAYSANRATVPFSGSVRRVIVALFKSCEQTSRIIKRKATEHENVLVWFTGTNFKIFLVVVLFYFYWRQSTFCKLEVIREWKCVEELAWLDVFSTVDAVCKLV